MNARAAVLAALALAAAAGRARADVYMHSPRGSNDRNCERNVNRNNGNRLFDSQNNAKGGYACPRAVGGQGMTLNGVNVENAKMYYYVGEKVYLEWTNQHGGGDNGKLHSEVIWQYACTDTLDPTGKFNANGGTTIGTPRDGIPTDGNDAATDRIPDNRGAATPDTGANLRFGMHESYEYYQECQRTSRNLGLYTADQNVNRNDARGTRQNPNGNRNGLECPEERDYYPYWRPSPWRDIAVVTSEWSANKAAFYKANANQKMQRGFCAPVNQADYNQKRNQRRWYNNQAQCTAAGHTWRATYFAPEYATSTTQPALSGATAPDMLVVQGEESRVNQLGNSARSLGIAYPRNQRTNQAPFTFSDQLREYCQNGQFATQAGRGQCGALGSTGVYQDQQTGRLWDDNTGMAMSANSLAWVVPNHVQGNCVLRLRYNISTWDFPGWQGGNRYLAAGTTDTFTGEPGVNSTYNCRGDTKNGVPCTQVSPVTQDPYVQMTGTGASNGNMILSLALNTNQYARTFQDRTYVFSIRARPSNIPATATIVALGVRGKRGNIVQTYPSVEYDFAPDNIAIKTNDYLHIQWTGSDYNPQRGCNNGEGGPPDCQGCTNLQQQINAGNQNSRADRTNLVFMDVAGNNFPRGARGLSVDRYSAAMTATSTPFADMGTVWDLAYIKQEAQISARGLQCLTQTELENINNKNQRENHPQNCAKLNAAQHPYFDAGAVQVQNAGRFTAQSTRNNNFSNRDQTMNFCVAGSQNDLTNCHTDQLEANTGAPNAHFSGGATAVVIDGIAITEPGAQNSLVDGETTAPIEKDNDGVGDGEKEACEARLHEFLSSIGIAGIVAIAVALLMVGIIGTLIVQGLMRRYKGNNAWLQQSGTKV